MILLAEGEPVPEDALFVATIDGQTYIYEAADPEYVEVVVQRLKQSRFEEMHIAHQSALRGGFVSSATGQELNYSIDEEDMQDLSNLIALNRQDNKYRAGIGKRFVNHTLPQLKQVRDDGTEYKFAIYEKLELLIDQIEAAQTPGDFDVIVW